MSRVLSLLLTVQHAAFAMRLESRSRNKTNRGVCEYGWSSGPI
eukprot:CAMPEP_0197879418 /NCGR_PEP_ID=MMETSP1439-20131203/7522_1 /TAXON_ID=66791 /ORGANISM="Gonyaulax spinifera, Strain CCMP409" /LENGTH=42 /DNA_ID= /DNA_START= /DNA_END= /DNA_ORIENTATION=